MKTLNIALGVLFGCACGVSLAASTSRATAPHRMTEEIAQGAPAAAAAKDVAADVSPATITCPGFANTRVIDLSWSNPKRMYTRDIGGFGVRDVLVIRFTTGPKSSIGRQLPRISAAEYGALPNWRIATLSAKPCDFEPQSTPGATMAGTSITAVFGLGEVRTVVYYPVLDTNRTYYLNIKNSAESSCAASGVCDMFVDLIKAGDL